MEAKGLLIGELEFKNPVILASGTFGVDEYTDFLDYSKIGGVTLKTVTLSPREGNPPPRILEVRCGLLNSIGLENDGFENFVKKLRETAFLKNLSTNKIVSIAGDCESDFSKMVRVLSEFDSIDMFELNLSCPNLHEGGINFDSNFRVVRNIVRAVAKISRKPFTVKLGPSGDLVVNSKVAEDYGADALTISNTFLATAIDIKKRAFYFKNKVAGYSGPAVKPMALWNVYRVSNIVKIPVIASGGICDTSDAIEFLMAGARFISTGTMNFVEPSISLKIAEELERIKVGRIE
ncbi:MAG: dihydroorotate dehydrogenase [Brevinematia bacterium]